jgi:hypothetical protein
MFLTYSGYWYVFKSASLISCQISIFTQKTMVKTKHACVMDVVQIICGYKYFMHNHDNKSKSYLRSTFKIFCHALLTVDE